MSSGIVAPRPEEGPSSARGDKPRRSGLHGVDDGGYAPKPLLRAVDQSIVLAHVSDLLAAGAPTLAPADLLTAVCQAAAGHLSLTNVVLFKRLAGQSRTLAWSAPGVAAWSRMIAREQAWKRAAAFLDERRRPTRERDGEAAVASVWDERLGLSALLYAESRRRLDEHDHRLLEELLRRMLVLPSSPES
jgi:hypothetical protein